MLYEKFAKPLLFRMDPEDAHHMTINGLSSAAKIPGMLSLASALYGTRAPAELKTDLWGIAFPHPVGLAAGLDKNAAAVEGFSSLGFGFLEVGTVTPEPQPGNERPRLFRLPADQALINRMGFNNDGANAMAERLGRTRRSIPLAVNIGKNKWTPNERAADDYVSCLRTLFHEGDFFVVNVSSPNTPGLRDLQFGDEMYRLLSAVMAEAGAIAGAGKRKPVLVKIAPDMQADNLEVTMQAILKSGVNGIIATNTTVSREGLTHAHAKETGGLSGKPLFQRSTEMIREVYRLSEGKLPIIGSGGIFNAVDAYAKIRAGASLVEIYTALIYGGPAVIKRMVYGLSELLRQDGFTNISQAVGVDA